jgi:hypothetical protein
MIEQRRLFILGQTMLADGMIRLLAGNQKVIIVGYGSTLESALPYLENNQVDMLVIAGLSEMFEEAVGELGRQYFNVSILYANPDRNYMEIFSVKRVATRYADLSAAIEALPC